MRILGILFCRTVLCCSDDGLPRAVLQKSGFTPYNRLRKRWLKNWGVESTYGNHNCSDGIRVLFSDALRLTPSSTGQKHIDQFCPKTCSGCYKYFWRYGSKSCWWHMAMEGSSLLPAYCVTFSPYSRRWGPVWYMMWKGSSVFLYSIYQDSTEFPEVGVRPET